jgi:hypothetical protein
MRHFENQTFEGIYDLNSGRLFCDAEFYKCYFLSSSLSITLDPKLRSTIRNIRLVNCEQRGCSLNAAIVQDVVVDGLKTNGLYQTWAAVFQRVIIKGKIERIMMSGFVAPARATKEQQVAFDEANALFYSKNDWALDISQAECEELEIQGIPASLIKRDIETQVVVTRAKALAGAWRILDLSKTHWATSLDLFLKRGDSDMVLVAPKRGKKFKALLNGLKMLRDANVAEPN